jgi:hypothetical protein
MGAGAGFDATAFESRIAWIKGHFATRLDPQPIDHEAPIPVFVVGPSRSGKTLIELTLAEHGEVHAAGEGDQWATALRTVADRHGLPNSLLRLMEGADETRAAEIGEAYRRAMMADAPAARWFVNTAPGYFETVGLIL